MAYRYQSLGSLNFVTQTWFMPNTPVGPHRRVDDRPDHSLLAPEIGGALTTRKPKVVHKYDSQPEVRPCAIARQQNRKQKESAPMKRRVQK